jgi:PHP family Zn ribbon phosphoesterase
MRTPGPQNPYEVYCYQCNVTAPAGTRRCIHCGGSISRGVQDPRRAALAALVGAELGEADEEDDEAPPSAASLVPKIALWILLLFGGFLYRFCN